MQPLIERMKSKQGDLEQPLIDGKKSADAVVSAAEAKYRGSLGMAIRTATMCLIIASVVFVPSWYTYYNDDPFWSGYLSLVPGGTLLLVVFTVYQDYGTTLQQFYQGVVGTAWACAWTHVMFALMPNGAAGDHYYAPLAHASHIVFVFLSMWFNLSKNLRMFILSYQVYFAADLMNPGNVDVYNKDWSIDWSAYTTTTLMTAVAGAVAAVFVPLLPFPVFAKRRASNTAKDTVDQLCKCMEDLCDYFKGSSASVVIIAKEMQIAKVSDSVDGMMGNISGMWWETFDLGASGKVRQLLTSHAGMLRTLTDNMMAMQVCISKEDFGSTHTQCMKKIGDSAAAVCAATRTVLQKATDAASDGDISQAEADELESTIVNALNAVQELSQKFNQSRKSIAQALNKKQEEKLGRPTGRKWQQEVINAELQSESFFVYCLCAYARQATSYSLKMIKQPVKKPNMIKDVWASFMEAFTPAVLYKRLDLSGSAIRGTIEILLCYYVGLYWCDYSAAAACTVSLLIAEFTGSALQKNMGRIQAVVIGALVPHILYQMLGTSCGTITVVGKMITFWLFEVLACYIFYDSPTFGYIGCLVAAFAVGVLAYPCGASGTSEDAFDIAQFSKMTNTILGVIIMTLVDMVLASERASDGANREFLSGLLMIDTWFQGMFFVRNSDSTVVNDKEFKCRADIASDHKTSKHVVKTFHGKSYPSTVSSTLSLAAMLGREANNEPRYHRTSWKVDFFNSVVRCSFNLRQDLSVIEQVLMGVKKSGVNSYSAFNAIKTSDAWKSVRDDVINTLGNAFEMVQAVLENETGAPMPVMKEKMSELEGADSIEAMGDLFKAINASGLTYPDDKTVTSMEDDEICRLNVVLMLFDSCIETMSEMLKECLKQG